MDGPFNVQLPQTPLVDVRTGQSFAMDTSTSQATPLIEGRAVDSFKRTELQTLLKSHGLREHANKKKGDMIDALKVFLKSRTQGLHEERSVAASTTTAMESAEAITARAAEPFLGIKGFTAPNDEQMPGAMGLSKTNELIINDEPKGIQQSGVGNKMEPVSKPNDKAVSSLSSSEQEGAEAQGKGEPESTISEWLTSCGLENVIDVFAREQIDSWVLVKSLELETLKAMGLTVGASMRVLMAIKEKFPAAKSSTQINELQTIISELMNLSLAPKGNKTAADKAKVQRATTAKKAAAEKKSVAQEKSKATKPPLPPASLAKRNEASSSSSAEQHGASESLVNKRFSFAPGGTSSFTASPRPMAGTQQRKVVPVSKGRFSTIGIGTSAAHPTATAATAATAAGADKKQVKFETRLMSPAVGLKRPSMLARPSISNLRIAHSTVVSSAIPKSEASTAKEDGSDKKEDAPATAAEVAKTETVETPASGDSGDGAASASASAGDAQAAQESAIVTATGASKRKKPVRVPSNRALKKAAAASAKKDKTEVDGEQAAAATATEIDSKANEGMDSASKGVASTLPKGKKTAAGGRVTRGRGGLRAASTRVAANKTAAADTKA
ncbi:hypothetical protein HK102_009988 [Quaeritorhiza haematococci]|nr:hypothetical protein HK102_009988 [Quaeritorhiza haematococci]